MDEELSRQARRFFAAMLTYGKENQRSMPGKDPRCFPVVNTGSKE